MRKSACARLAASLLAAALPVGASNFSARLPAAPRLSPGVASGPASLAPSRPAAALSVAPSIGLPALAPSIAASLPGAGAARNSAPLPPGAVPVSAGEALRRLAAGAPSGEGGDPSASGGLSFDGNGSRRKRGAGSGAASAPVSPRIPPGVQRVSVGEVRTKTDIALLIPVGINSVDLIDKLKENLPQMVPYLVYTYHDRFGGKSVAIDISRKPALIENFPEQQSHEIALIKRILGWNQDVQIMVREDGKTPDIVLAGVVTELKSVTGQATLKDQINHANNQVYEHARRHGLGHGAVAVNLVSHAFVPVQDVVDQLNQWVERPEGKALAKGSREAPKSPIFVDKVFVFAQRGMRIFSRQPDGWFALDSGAAAAPDIAPQAYRPPSPSDVPGIQMLVHLGRLEEARRRLHVLERAAPPELGSPLAQARALVEGEFLIAKIRQTVQRRKMSRAQIMWRDYARTHDESAVAALEPRVREILPATKSRRDVPTESDLFLSEVEEPARLRRNAGIKRWIAVFGSERAAPHTRYWTEARQLGILVARHGDGSMALATDGGAGIMAAANQGAYEAGGASIVYSRRAAAYESRPYATADLSYEFEYSQPQDAHLRRRAAALVFFPGGFDAADHLLKTLALIKSGKMKRVPIVLVGDREDWDLTVDFEHLVRKGLITREEIEQLEFVQTAEQAFEAVTPSLQDR